jgi:hypothetical protein
MQFDRSTFGAVVISFFIGTFFPASLPPVQAENLLDLQVPEITIESFPSFYGGL